METHNKKTICFCDVDGVLNSEKSCSFFHKKYGKNGYGGGFFDSSREAPTEENVQWDIECVNNLKKIIDYTNAKIVISSTWRRSHSVEAFIKMFEVYGWVNAPIIDLTPKDEDLSQENLIPFRKMSDYSYPTRGYEIEFWLKCNPCDNYVILDDSSDMTDEQKASHFVRTNPGIGLTEEDADLAIQILSPLVTPLLR